MKSSIIFIFGLFPFVKIQLIHCGGDNENISSGLSDDKESAVIPWASIFGINGSAGEGDVGPSGSRAFVGSTQYVHPVIPKGAMTNLDKDEMRKKAVADYKAAIRKAELTLEEADSKLKPIFQELDKECQEAIKIANNKLLDEDAIAKAILRQANRKFNEVERGLVSEYEQVATIARKNFEKAEREISRVVEEADDKFLATYSELEKRRQKLESEHRDDLEKGRNELEAALKAADARKAQAEKEFKAPRRRRGSSWDAVRAKYEAEMEKYDEAVELAENQWQKVLENVGLGREYEEAIQKAVAELRESQDQAPILLSQASEQLEVTLQNQKPDDKLKAAMSSALADNYDAKKRYDEAYRNAVNKRNLMVRKAQRKWKKAVAPVKAAEEKALNEYKIAEAKANEAYETTLKKISKTPGRAPVKQGQRRPLQRKHRAVTSVSNGDAAEEV